MTTRAGFLQPRNTISVVRGTTKTLTLSVTNASGEPVDLTGGAVYMTVRDAIECAPRFFKSSSNPAEIELDADPRTGKATIKIVPGDTSSLPLGEYVFDVWVELASGERYAVVPLSLFVVVGSVTVLP